MGSRGFQWNLNCVSGFPRGPNWGLSGFPGGLWIPFGASGPHLGPPINAGSFLFHALNPGTSFQAPFGIAPPHGIYIIAFSVQVQVQGHGAKAFMSGVVLVDLTLDNDMPQVKAEMCRDDEPALVCVGQRRRLKETRAEMKRPARAVATPQKRTRIAEAAAPLGPNEGWITYDDFRSSFPAFMQDSAGRPMLDPEEDSQILMDGQRSFFVRPSAECRVRPSGPCAEATGPCADAICA